MKTCTKCGECKPLEAFNPKKGYAGGRNSQCQECVRARARAYNKTAAAKACQERCTRTPRTKQQIRRYSAKQKETLSIGYIHDKLRRTTGIPTEQIPDSLVELKREQLALRRLSKQLIDAAKETNEPVQEHP